MKPEDTIGVLETLLPEGYVENHAFPPGWGGGFSPKNEVSTEVAEVLEQYIDKHQNSEKTAAVQEQSVDWLESVWSEEALQRDAWGKWVLEGAKNPEELKGRVKKLKEERAAKQREKEKREEERKRREEEEAERQRLEAEARREARQKARKKREAERKKQEEEAAERQKIEEQEAEERREARRQERARRKEEDAAVVAEQVAAITASMQKRKEEKERIKQERRQKQREEMAAAERRDQAQRRVDYEERRRRDEDEHGRLGWTIVLNVVIAVALLCGLWGICHGFDVPLAKTGAVWSWCWWHLKFIVGLGFVINLILYIVVFGFNPGERDSISRDRYEDVVSPLVFKFLMAYIFITIGMFIYALCHLFSALGFSFRAFGMGALFLVEFLCVGLLGMGFSFLCNGLLWGHYGLE